MGTSAPASRRGLSNLVHTALLVATSALATAAGAQPLEWQPRTPMPLPATRMCSGVVDRTLYVLGGAVSDGVRTTVTDAVQAYDVETDTWSFLAPLSEPRFAAASATEGGTIYLAGGAGAFPPVPYASVIAYDVDHGGKARPVATLGTARYRTSAALLNGKLYVVGGAGAAGTVANVEQVDLATGAVVELAPLPEGRQMAAVAAFAGSLYVMGGHDPAGNPTDTCWKLRPPYGSWAACATLPYPRAGRDTEMGRGYILLPSSSVSSGTPSTVWSSDVLQYDPRTDAWSVRGSLGVFRSGASGVVQDHLLVAGVDAATGLAVTEIAALQVPAWPVLPLAVEPRLPTPRGGGFAAVVDGQIFAIAGTNRNDPPPAGMLPVVESFDVATRTWWTRTPLPEARFSVHGAAIGPIVYLPAGGSPSGNRADVLAYDTRTGASWIDGALLQPRFRHGAAAIGSRLFVVGGWNAGALDAVEAYDVETHLSVPVAPLPAARHLPSVVAVDGVLYALGGYDAADLPSADVWAYDPATGSWSARSPLPVATGGAGTVVVGGRIVVLGGNLDGGPYPANLVSAVQVYDPLADAWTTVGSLDTFRWMAFSAAVGGEVFLMGGNDDAQPLSLVESFLFQAGGAPPISVIDWPADGSATNLVDLVVSGRAWGETGVSAVQVSVDGGGWESAAGLASWTYLWQPLWEGWHRLETRAVDPGGAVGAASGVSVMVDWTAPEMAASIAPPGNGTGWWNVPVTVSFECSDALSGVASCPSPIVLGSEGADQAASGTASDRAGNSSSTQVLASIDLTAPTILASPSRPSAPSGWWNAPVTVSFACADALSGVAACSAPVTVSTEGADQPAAGAAADLAGNAAATTLPVSIDWTSPMVVAEPATPPNAAGWWNQPVTIPFACSDERSGVAACSDPVTVPFDGAGIEVDGWVTDGAENGAMTMTFVNVDMTPPECSATASGLVGPDGTYRSSAVVTVAAGDALSGVATVEVDTGAGFVPYAGPFVVSDPGTTVVTCRVVDVAGNEGMGFPLAVTIAPDAALAWTPHAPMPAATTRAASGVVDRTLYVLGGLDATGRVTRNVWAYDADADAWLPMPPLPEPRTSAGSATLDATIYLAGGNGGPTTLSTVLAYDVDTGGSRTLATLATPRYRAGAAISANKLYVVGGWRTSYPGAALDSVEVFDLATGAALPSLTLPAPRQSAGVATYGGYLYVMGGLDANTQPTDTCWKVRITYPSAWLPCATLPYPRSGLGLVGHGKILLSNNNVSGIPPTAWTHDVLAYDPSTDAWSTLGQTGANARGAAEGVIQDQLYIAGGTDGTTTLALNASAPLHVPEVPVLPWRLRPRLTDPRSAATPAVADGRVLLLGGTGPTDATVATVEAFDPAMGAWTVLPPLAEPRTQCPGGVLDGVVYLAAGSTPIPGRTWPADVLAYDTRTGASWIDGPLLSSRYRHGAAVLGTRLYLAGGRNMTGLLTSVEAYDLTTRTSTLLAPLPGTRDLGRVVAAGGRLFVLGGYETTPEPTMLEYDFAHDAWINHPPPPFSSGGGQAIAVGRNILVISGAAGGPGPTAGEGSDLVQMYDPSVQTWTILGSLDTFRSRGAAAFLGGEVYFMGGFDGSVPLSLVESYLIDATLPTSTILSPADGSATNAREIFVSGTASDDLGVIGVDVSDDGGATWWRASGRRSWSWTWMPLAEGPYTLMSRTTDSSGYLQDPPASAQVTVDWTAPEVSASAAPPATADGWWKTPVTVSFACSDALSGLASCAAPVTVSSEGAGQDVTGTGTDRAGNAGSATLTVNLDATAPTISAALTPAPNALGWGRAPVTVSFACADALSGIASCSAPVLVDHEDSGAMVSGRATDRAGNTAIAPARVSIDWTPPSITAAATPAPNAAGWWNAPVTVSFACSDALSHVATCTAPVTVEAETAGQAVAGTATDNADNTATTSLTVKLDRTAPTCTVAAAGTIGGNGIYVSNVTVTVSAADALSGVAAVEVSTGAGWAPYTGPITVAAEGATTVSCRATDVAGNQTTGALSFTIDRVAPAVAATYPANGATGIPVTAAITLTFSEPVLAGSTWAQVALLNGKKVVSTARTISGAVVTIRPVAALERSRTYTVSVPAGAVADLAGNAFAGRAGAAYTFAFTTAR